MNPKISILVTVYNLAPYLEETLESILVQDYENYEVVIADDASTDGSQEILESYARRYPKKFIIVKSQVNRGVTANSNAALQYCTGELIAILDGDDVLLPGKLSAQVQQFIDPNVVLSYHAGEIFDSDSVQTLYVTNQSKSEDTNSAEDIITKGGISCTSSVMIRKSACPPEGFDMTFPKLQDWLFFIEVAMHGKVAKLDGIYVRYRKRGKGISSKTYELLDHSLGMLDLLVKKYPDRPDLVDICNRGKARYLAGEVYRQLSKDPNTALRLARDMLAFDQSNKKYQLLYAFSLIEAKVPIFFSLAAPVIRKSKYFLKRYIS